MFANVYSSGCLAIGPICQGMWIGAPSCTVLCRTRVEVPVGHNLRGGCISSNLLAQLEDGERYRYDEREEAKLKCVPCFQTEGSNEEGHQCDYLQQQEHQDGREDPPQLALPGCETVTQLSLYHKLLGGWRDNSPHFYGGNK